MITRANGDSWEAVTCPACGINNWVCHGNLQDETQPDRDGCKCWNCGVKWMFPGVESAGDGFYADGQRNLR